MSNGTRPITVSQETLEASLATLELRLVREMTEMERRSQIQMEKLQQSIAGNPETFAGVKARIADVEGDVEELQKSDRRYTLISTLVSSVIAMIVAWFAPKP